MHYKYLKMHIYSFTWMLVDFGTDNQQNPFLKLIM